MCFIKTRNANNQAAGLVSIMICLNQGHIVYIIVAGNLRGARNKVIYQC